MQGSRAQNEHDDLSSRVVNAVAAELGCSPVELKIPLYNVIDPDALDAIFSGESRTGSIEFTYLGFRVTVNGRDSVEIRPQQNIYGQTA